MNGYDMPPHAPATSPSSTMSPSSTVGPVAPPRPGLARTGCKAILHIGGGKTGSSAIQTLLKQNVSKLSRRGVRVPDADLKLRDTTAGHCVFHLQAIFEKGEDVRSHLEPLVMEIGDEQTLLISAENMSNGRNYRLFERFAAEYPTKVVFYIRRQDEFLSSAWQQWQSKVRGDRDAWVEASLGKQVHWLQTIEGWEAAVGKGNVVPRIFERASLPGGDVTRDFLSVLGFNAENLDLPTGGVNDSYSNLITALVEGRTDLFDGPHDDAFYRFVMDLLREADHPRLGSVSLLTRSQRERILDFYAEENETIRQRYFPDRETLFSPLDHSRYRYAEDDDVRDEQIAFLLGALATSFKRLRKL